MLTSRICDIFLLSLLVLSVAGCGSGGGGAGAMDVGGSRSGVISFAGSDSSSSSGTTIVDSSLSSSEPIANPEPSSILLLGSGLIGMAIYARARLKNKGK